MRDAFRRLALLLAASGLNDRFIEAAAIELSRPGGRKRLIETVRSLRAQLATKGVFGSTEVDISSLADVALRTNFTDDVYDLLIGKTGLSEPVAATLLLESLARDGIIVELPAFNPKAGLKAWVKRISPHVPRSTILHHASSIRNRFAHGAADWPLKDREQR